MVHRYFDPTTARFISVDPLFAQTGEAYQYTGDNPLNETDPTGDCWGFCWVSHKLHSISHALTAVSKIANAVAAVSSTLAFIPVIGEAAEAVSLAAGVVALGADSLNCAGGHCDAGALALDVAAVVPGFGAAKVKSGIKATEEATEGIAKSGKYWRNAAGQFAKDPTEGLKSLDRMRVSQFGYRYAARGVPNAGFTYSMAH